MEKSVLYYMQITIGKFPLQFTRPLSRKFITQRLRPTCWPQFLCLDELFSPQSSTQKRWRIVGTFFMNQQQFSDSAQILSFFYENWLFFQVLWVPKFCFSFRHEEHDLLTLASCKLQKKVKKGLKREKKWFRMESSGRKW